MSELVGALDELDATVFCVPELRRAGGRTYARAFLRRVSSDGSAQDEVQSDTISQRVRVQCFENADLSGRSTTYTSAYSSDAMHDVTSTSACPPQQPYPGFLRCQIQSSSNTPLVYAGKSCGNGVRSVSPNPASCVGQLTGREPGICAPLFNDTFAQAGVWGTDVAATFYEGGQQYFAFGDTFSKQGNAPRDCGPLECWRSNTLAFGADFDPTSGIGLSGWQLAPGPQRFAGEVIAADHCAGSAERSKIPGAGFGYTTGSPTSHMKLLWYASVSCEDQASASHSAFAFQLSDGSWLPWAPRWNKSPSDFFPGALWADRVHGDLYLFGVSWYGGGVRLGRVHVADGPAFADRYEYWTGSSWRRDDNGDGAEAAPQGTARLTPDTPGLRAEISVVWNAYINRFMLMGLQWNAGYGVTLELWQSPAPAPDAAWPQGYLLGSWQRVASAYTPGYYAPMLSESYLVNGGKEVYFLLSNWDAYNVALYHFSVERNALTRCDDSDE